MEKFEKTTKFVNYISKKVWDCKKRSDKKPNPITVVFISVAMLLFILIISGGCMAKTDRKKVHISGISFSPDGRKIMFTRKKDDGPALLNLYDLETGELSAYQSPPAERWEHARYSYDGKHIAFVIMTKKNDGYFDLENMQIAIMDPDGRNVKKITNSQGTRIYPSFSHDGEKIIFARAGRIRESGKTPATDYDIWEVDIKTGKETRLTWYEFFLISAPYYLPDDKRFIFKGESPHSYPDIPNKDFDAIKKRGEEYKSKYGENWIFIMQAGEQILKPFILFPPENASRGKATFTGKPLITEKGKGYSDAPLITVTGPRIFFLAHSFVSTPTKGYDYQYYEYLSDGSNRSITNFVNRMNITDTAISLEGERIGVVYSSEPEMGIRKIIVCTVNDGKSKEITLPDNPSRIIN